MLLSLLQTNPHTCKDITHLFYNLNVTNYIFSLVLMQKSSKEVAASLLISWRHYGEQRCEMEKINVGSRQGKGLEWCELFSH